MTEEMLRAIAPYLLSLVALAECSICLGFAIKAKRMASDMRGTALCNQSEIVAMRGRLAYLEATSARAFKGLT